MASSNFQVNVGRFDDATAPLRNAIASGQAGIYRRQEVEKAKNAERAAAGKQLDIYSVLNGDLDQGYEVKDAVNTEYTDAVDSFNLKSALLKEKIATKKRDLIAAGLAEKTVGEAQKITYYDDNGRPVETPGLTILKQEKARLNADYDNYISSLNKSLQTRVATNPNLLDTVTDPQNVAKNIYDGILRKTGDANLAKAQYDGYLATHAGSGGGEVDYKKIKVLQDQVNTIIGDAQTNTTTTGRASYDVNGNRVSSKNSGGGGAPYFNSKNSEAGGPEYLAKLVGKADGWYDSLGEESKKSASTLIKDLQNETGKGYDEVVRGIAATIGPSGVWFADREKFNKDDALEYINSNKATFKGKGSNGTGIPKVSVKQKQYTPEQKRDIKTYQSQIARLLNGGGTKGKSVREVLGDKFLDHDPSTFTSKKIESIVKKAPEDKKVEVRRILTEAKKGGPRITNAVTTLKNGGPRVETKESTNKTALSEVLDTNRIVKATTPVEEAVKIGNSKSKTPKPKIVEAIKKDPKILKIVQAAVSGKEDYDTSITLDNVMRGAGISFEQAKKDPVGTAKDIGLGLVNAFPALVAAIGDVTNTETPFVDNLSKTLKNMRSDQNSLGFDLAEIVGPGGIGKITSKIPVVGKPLSKIPSLTTALTGGTKTAVKALNTGAKAAGSTGKITKVTDALLKTRKSPSLGTALGTTVKAASKINPTATGTAILNGYKATKAGKNKIANIFASGNTKQIQKVTAASNKAERTINMLRARIRANPNATANDLVYWKRSIAKQESFIKHVTKLKRRYKLKTSK